MGVKGILVDERINELTNITLKLYKQCYAEAELVGEVDDFDATWILEILTALSLQGNFVENVSEIHIHTYSILRTSIRNWNHGYSIQSTLDQEKIEELTDKLKEERTKILFDDCLSFDLKRILLIEIDRLINSLENFGLLGEENVKNIVTDFYASAFFNKDIQNYYQNNSSFKEVINDLSATITIGSFAAPNFVSLVDSITNSLPFK